ncbi:MAG: diphosphate--fructose-6-phosphate 1-phosphotransferase [Lentisphaerae bacterium]|jgi:pyrophosphate--fructose-6-phosphate 1-phosphotransferase|nr:diphosphate--fructose-6-phosphate 1-phosphotransferase [Lentisphaerota bacterium]
MTQISPLQKARASYMPKLPPVLNESGPFAKAVRGEATQSVADQAAIKALFPDTYGLPAIQFKNGPQHDAKPVNVAVILSGGQAPGGHNVIAGLYDGIKALNPNSKLYGFLGGPSGLIDNKYMVIDEDVVNAYRNTGGFDMICSGRTKLEEPEQFDKVIANCKALGINAIVIIGGDDSNTNACVLAQYMITKKTGIQVIGCPKTIDGDLKNEWIEVSFGFDTATKVYSELIGNIMRDANSARKYWHFIKLMGRSASHIALECALQTHPTACIISEEVEKKGTSLHDIVDKLTKLVIARSAKKMDFGVVLIPEGLIEFIPEIKPLIKELNECLAEGTDLGKKFNALTDMDAKIAFVVDHLSASSASVFKSFPNFVKAQLLGDRDPHGNVQVSRIETEKLLIAMVEENVKAANKANGTKVKFSSQAHFFGYEGRCAAPSNFDADYCYSLGFNASALIGAGLTGYMSSVRNVAQPATAWEAGGIPLTMMMNMERRHGKDVPVIRKALVELDAAPFKMFAKHRDAWAEGVDFVYPGPIQYFGPAEVCDRTTMTLQLERA